MTPSERNTLLFLGALLLLGVSVRVVRARAGEGRATGEEQAALAAQIAAVDSVRRGAGSAGRRSTSRSQNGSGPSGRSRSRTVREPSVVYDQPLRPTPGPGSTSDFRFPIPESRVVDLDLAPASEIEGLPWIGPVLAERIVANRDSLGPFGSMNGLQRVFGIGPGMARRLAGRVTFSQTPRHFRVEDQGKRASGRTRAGPLVRPRAP